MCSVLWPIIDEELPLNLDETQRVRDGVRLLEAKHGGNRSGTLRYYTTCSCDVALCIEDRKEIWGTLRLSLSQRGDLANGPCHLEIMSL